MRKQHWTTTLIVAGIGWMFFWGVPLAAGERIIAGRVVEVRDASVKVAYDGEYAPSPGDPIEIGFNIGEDFIAVEGAWKIEDVSPEFAWAAAEGPVAGLPAPDYKAVIHSKNPGKRSSLPLKGEPAKKGDHSRDSAAIHKEALKYYNGDGVPKNHKTALALFKEAGDIGHSLAQEYLGWMYQRGEGVEKDPVMAANWYMKAAAQNNTNAKIHLGVMYLSGEGVEKDYGMAHQLFREIVADNNQYGHWNLGRIHANGWGVEKNPATAFAHYLKAAELGHLHAQDKVGDCYLNGTGVTKDYAKAYDWSKKAADAGVADSHNRLGLIYLNGFGVPRDYAQAHALFEKAADGGNRLGYFNLGRLYDNGWGVHRNEQKALAYYQKFGDHVAKYKEGAREGHEEARQWLKRRNMEW